MKSVKVIKTIAMCVAAVLSFLTTVLCMRDVLSARDALQAKESNT